MKTNVLIRKMLIIALLGLTTIVNAQDRIYLGVRVPQMTTEERANIGAESNELNARGQLIFNKDTGKLQYWDGEKWVQSDETNVDVTSQDGSVDIVIDGSTFDLSVNGENVANSISNYISNTILGDSILNYITNNLDNPTYNLGDEIQNYISNYFSTELGNTITNYITNNFPPELGDVILNYITNNVTEEFVNNIMSKVNIASADNTVIVTGSGTSDIDLSVNIDEIGNQLVKNETFITNLGDELVNNETFVINMGDEIANNFSKTILGDTILNYIQNNLDDKDTQYTAGYGLYLDGTEFNADAQALADSIVSQIVNNINNLGDEILKYINENLDARVINEIVNEYLTQNFINDFGDEILNYITNNVTEELVNNIMAKVNITGANGIQIEGSGTSNITVKLPEGEREGQILIWDDNTSVWKPADQTPSVKQVTIAVENGTFDTKNLIFWGTTSTATNALKVVAIEPVFSNSAMRRNFLSVDATVQVTGNAAEWTVSIENRNISAANQQTLQSVVISYICDDATALTNSIQSITEISGY